MLSPCYRRSLPENRHRIYDTFSTFSGIIRFWLMPEKKMSRIRDKLAVSSVREETFVEGNTFHEYSTAISSRILDKKVSNGLMGSGSD